MKRIVLFFVVLLLFCSSAQAALTYGAAWYRERIEMSGTGYNDDPIYLFMNEVETEIEASSLEGGTTLTFSTNGGTFDNVINNTFRWGELSEYLTLTFSENATAWTSSTGVVLMDFGTVVPKTDQLLLDPVAAAVGTVEGTFYYDSDDDTPYYRNASAWVSLGAGTFAGGSITSDVTLSDGVDVLSSTTTAHTNSLQGRDIDGAAYVDVLRWTNSNTVALVLGAPTVSFALASTGVDISTAGAVSGVTTLSMAGAITGATDITASGALTAGSWSIGTFATTGATTLGDNTSTVAINSSSWDITTGGAVSGLTTVAMSGDLTLSAGSVVLATGQVVKGSTTTAETIALQVYDNDTGPGYKNAILLTNGNTPAIAIGDGNPTVAVNSSDWDISTAGAMTGIGAITMDGLLTGTLGATITGAAVNLNASSNFAVNIGTGTTNVQVTIGAGTAPFAIDSTAFDVSNAGAVSGVTTLSLSDSITMADGKVIKGTTTTANTIKMQAYDNDTGPAYVDALTITNGNAPGISFGNNATTVAVNSTDWDIDATGAMTGIGAITADGLITGSLGLTITAATVNLNASSNFAVNIGTGTATGAIGIGGGQTTQLITIASSIGGATPLVFEGATDNDIETIFAITDPTVADKTITFQNATEIAVIDVAPIDTDNNGKTVLAAEAVNIQYCTGAGTWVLPEASTVLGKSFTFVVGAVANIVIDPADGVDLIAYSTNVAGDSLVADAVGESITLTAIAVDVYAATAATGTWTDNN